MRDDCRDYRALFLADTPLIDVRAPVEFHHGAFAHACNLPLMDDREREQVGTCFKQHGQQAAIELGHRLVQGALKQARIDAWRAFTERHPDGYLYCYRGGLRSQISQQWLRDEAGVQYPRVVGGYKALRHCLLSVTEEAAQQCDFVLLGGMTGTGKTEVLQRLDNALDLEGHAHHRGSSFGKHATPQPVQINFENQLAVDILKQRERGVQQFVLEDEGRAIGSRAVPLALYRRMQGAPLVWLLDSVEQRVQRILKDYVVDLCAEFVGLHGADQGFALFAQRMQQSLASNVKRLGGERFQRLASAMDAALDEQYRSGAVELHRAWIRVLLDEYYDPMYAYQRQAKGARIEFMGSADEVEAYLHHRRRQTP